ncbi:MAG TPA: M23 family metallopeptidase [Chitinophagaceae bacterium]|nr:M23 family metallopeptidase [Chitinophagaceae bacterium]
MKSLVRICLVGLLLYLPDTVHSQNDNFRLICPLNDAIVVPPPKNALQLDEPDLCIVLTSIPDTTVKSVGTGRVTNTELTEENGYGVVLFSKINGKDYYFWYTGLNKLLVRRNDVIKVGQPLGYISPGSKIELTMYQFETPVDPLKHLDCKGILRGF